MEIPFYRNMYLIAQKRILQIEFFDYGRYTQVVISHETNEMLISGSGADICRKRAYQKALEKFQQHKRMSFVKACIGQRRIKL